MPRSVYSYIRASQPALTSVNGGGFNHIVQATNGALYAIVSNSWGDVNYLKSTDGGLTWSPPISVFAGTLTAMAVWYDRWTPGLTSDYIHIVYTESGGSDTLYRTINTASSDALSTQTTIFAGASTATDGHLAVTRARGGNVYCKTVIDAGVEGGFYRLPNANVPNGAWDAVRTINETLATQDQVILMPWFTADNQDIILLHWDASADEISYQIYDDSANTWSETSIAGTMVDVARTTSGPHYAACCHTTNSEVLMVAWSNTDVAAAELSFWTITDDSGSATFNSGSGSWTVPTGVTSVVIECWGAGGGGSGGGANFLESGAGGGGGAYLLKTQAVTPGDSVAYSVGAIGTGGTSGWNIGTNGGDSTCTTYSLTAGGGKASVTLPTNAGVGGTATGGDTNTSGTNGTAGGSPANGTGGAGANGGAGGTASGEAGTAPGGGGAGGTDLGPNAGGNGAAGRVSFTYTVTTVTQGTSVVASSTDDQGACAIGYDATTNEIYVFYCGKTDGSETWFTAVNIYYKISTDGGTTWGPETQLTPAVRSIPAIFCCPRTLKGPPLVMFLDYSQTAQPSWTCPAPYVQPQSQSMIVM